LLLWRPFIIIIMVQTVQPGEKDDSSEMGGGGLQIHPMMDIF